VAGRAVTFGLSGGAQFGATILQMEGAQTRCTIRRGGRPLGKVVLPVPGRYNVRNALAATAVALELGLPFEAIARGLGSFGGVRRRFDVRGEVDEVMVVDDYAHNPIKIAAVLGAAKECWPARRVVAIFQPHRYSRTKTTYRRFAQVFEHADELIITEIYPADETPIPGVTASLIVDAVRVHHPVTFVPETAAVVDHLLPRLRPGDLVLTLGAGDVWKVADTLVAALRRGAAASGTGEGLPSVAAAPPGE
jgi:UDP-N-acetylmuramate--alanine ligase